MEYKIIYIQSNDTPLGLLRDPGGRPLFLLCVIPVEVPGWKKIKKDVYNISIYYFFL